MNTETKNDICNSKMTIGLHTGTHLDAARHFIPGASTMDEYPLERFIGPVRVIEINEENITAANLASHNSGDYKKIILKTGNSELWRLNQFEKEFTALTPDGAEYLLELGIELIGIDYLSIETFGSDGTVHRKLLQKNVIILEGLNLSQVVAGDYYLIALPLKIIGSEASPTRAILIQNANIDLHVSSHL